MENQEQIQIFPRHDNLPLMGTLYGLVLDIGTTLKDKCGLRGIFDQWYTTIFDYKGLSVAIHEWRNWLALDSFLDSISIKRRGLLVYEANVCREDHNLQRVRVFNLDQDWREKAFDFLSSYGRN